MTEIVGILCSTPELAGGDSMQKAGLINVGMRAATEITIAEVTRGDLDKAASSGIPTRIIAPQIDVHSGFDVKPSLIEISMHYGWMRAADTIHLVAAEQDECDRTSELITRLRLRCWQLETVLRNEPLRMSRDDAKWGYFELRVNRWAIMYLSDRRGALGLPPHPDQLQLGWASRWEKEFRSTGTPTVWSDLHAQIIDAQGLIVAADLWPASSPRQFNPDAGSIEDAGSDRIYWLVRGAIFEDLARAPLANPAANVVVPTGLHQFLPTVPDGAHLMAEVQDPMTRFLVIDGKKYASPTPEWIAAAGLIGATTAIVPTGGLTQIPDGGVPSFLGNLTVVNDVAHHQPLSEVRLERLQGSSSTADILLYNRSATTITVTPPITLTGVGAAQGVTIVRTPTSIDANAIDSITLQLDPTQAGVSQGSIEISSDDTVVKRITVG